MKRWKQSVFIALMVVGLSVSHLAADVNDLSFPEINKIQLPEIGKASLENGLRVRLIQTEKLPLVDVRILIKGGAVFDPSHQVGLAAATAQLLRIGGTESVSGEEIDKLLDREGITISISAADDYFIIDVSCLRETLPLALKTLAQIVMKPRFAEEKLEEIKAQMASGISRRNDSPGPINSREFDRLIYGKDSPFAAVQEYAHLENITLEDIRRVHRLFFAPDNMLVGVTGPMSLEEAVDVFTPVFGTWNHKAQIPAYPEVKAPEHDFRVAFAEKGNLNQSYLSIGHLGIKENLEEKAGIMVFNAIFSQGFNSRLMTRVRVKMGLTYGIGGGIISQRLHKGKTYFSTFTKSESTIKAIRAILDEVDKIRAEKVTDRELKDAKDYFINSHIFKYSTRDRILNNELIREFYGLPEGYAEKLIEDIKGVTADDVLSVARTYLDPDKMIVFVLGHREALDGDLADLGKVKEIDISIPPAPMKETIPEPTEETVAKGESIMEGLFTGAYKGYRGLKTLTVSAERKMMIQGQLLPMQTEVTASFPGKSYTKISVMGMQMEYIINGDRGIMKQMGQVKPLPEDNVRNAWFSDMRHMMNHPDEYRFQYLREQEIEGKPFDVVYITNQDKSKWARFFVNRDSGLVEIEESAAEFPGATGVARKVKSDFRTISGIPFAFKSVTTVKEKVMAEVTVKSIEVNPAVDQSVFVIETEDKKQD